MSMQRLVVAFLFVFGTAMGQVMPKEVKPGKPYGLQNIKSSDVVKAGKVDLCGSYFANSRPLVYFELRGGGFNPAIISRSKFATKLVEGQKAPTVTFLQNPELPDFQILVHISPADYDKEKACLPTPE